MNGGKDCVHVIARDFSDFLRLLLATGDSAALEQAWQWDEAQFDAFLAENPPTDEQKAVLSQITTVFSLTPMERPWQYLRKLQAEFDLSKLKFTEDFYDPEMNGDAPERVEEWKVYFDGSFWGNHGASARAGKCLYKSGFRGRGATGSCRRFTFVQRALSLIFVCARSFRAARLYGRVGSIQKRQIHRLLARRTRTDGARARQPRFYPSLAQPNGAKLHARATLQRHFPLRSSPTTAPTQARHGALRPRSRVAGASTLRRSITSRSAGSSRSPSR